MNCFSESSCTLHNTDCFKAVLQRAPEYLNEKLFVFLASTLSLKVCNNCTFRGTTACHWGNTLKETSLYLILFTPKRFMVVLKEYILLP